MVIVRQGGSRKGPFWAGIALTLGMSLGLVACAGAEQRPPEPSDTVIFDSPFGHYLAARHAERERDLSNAARFVAKVLERDPNNLEILHRAHLLMLGDGRFAEAVTLARRIDTLSPNNPPANLTLAVAEARNGNFAAAQQHLDGLPLTGANRVLLPLIRAWLEVAQGRPAAALNVLRALDEIDGFRPLYEYHAALINDLTGRPDAAEEHYQRALAGEGGTSIRVIEAAGNFFERQGRPAVARQIYTRYGAPFSDSVLLAAAMARLDANGPPPLPIVSDARTGIAEALFNVAGALRQEGGGQLALAYGRLALALVPDKPAGLLLVADVLDSAGRHAEANALFARIPRQSPLWWSARLRIAENLDALGDSEAAIRELEAMAAERPERIDALVTLGQLLRMKQRFAEAARVYDEAIARLDTVEPRHWSLFYARGISYERSKQWNKAEADFLRALELQPEQPDVLNYLAYSWVEQGVNYDRALRMLERAVELRPNSGHIIDSLGWALFRLGKFEEAVPLLERAAELMPEDPVILDHLGDGYWRVGRLAEARFQWMRALRNKPEPELRAEIERKLERGLAAQSESGG